MLKYKFSYIYNAMDRVLRTFEEDGHGFSVTLNLKHLMIVTKQSDSAVLDRYNQKGSTIDPLKPWKVELDGTGLLSYVKSWSSSHGLNFKEYDSIMYYHNYDMVGAVGWAYTGAICGYSGVSTVRDHGFETWTTATHEFGHTMGAGHDTAKTGQCAYILMHIMTIVWGSFSGKFSQCSISAIKRTLSRKRCLSNRTNHFKLPDMELAGKKFDADWQCAWKFSKEYFKDRGYEMDSIRRCEDRIYETDCERGISCGGIRRKTGRMFCSGTGVMYLPADGTPCAKGKMCLHEKCVPE